MLLNRKKSEKSADFFYSKSAEMKTLLFKVGMGTKLPETKFFDLCREKIELM